MKHEIQDTSSIPYKLAYEEVPLKPGTILYAAVKRIKSSSLRAIQSKRIHSIGRQLKRTGTRNGRKDS